MVGMVGDDGEGRDEPQAGEGWQAVDSGRDA